jgi:hypothetical protein
MEAVGLVAPATFVRQHLVTRNHSTILSQQGKRMMDFLSLCIADVPLAVHWEETADLVPLEPGYESFRGRTPKGQEAIHIQVHPELPSSWDIDKFEKIYASGQSWSLFRNGTDHLLAIDPPEFKQLPLCVARFNHQALNEVDTHYNRLAVKETGGRRLIPNPFSYPLDRLLMMYIFAERAGVMMHAAGVDIDGKGYIFPGKSGKGKSTLSRQFVSKKGPVVLSDERIAVRKINGEFKTFGTPWPGDAEIAVNRGVPLSGICFIHHGSHNRIREIESGEAAKRLLSLATIPWFDPEMMTKTLNFCEDLISHVPSYDLLFTPDGVVDIMEEFASHA